MARKDRAPTPPRRSQGPQRRGGAPDPQRTRLLLYALAGSGLLALAIVVGIVALGGGGGGAGARAALEKAGCTLRTFKAQKGTHLTDLEAKPKWNSNPPTSGPHYVQPAIWGAYDEPLILVQVVHNLEHGGVYVFYGDKVPQATVAELRGFYDGHVDGTLLAPLPSLGNKIALGAWVDETPGEGDDGQGVLAECTRFDEKAFSAFFDAYQFKGPERFSPDQLMPGS